MIVCITTSADNLRVDKASGGHNWYERRRNSHPGEWFMVHDRLPEFLLRLRNGVGLVGRMALSGCFLTSRVNQPGH